MRRKEKEINVQSEIEAIIQEALVCRLGLADENFPYIVPLCFGYQDKTIYIHTACEGKKIDILRRNPNVCFEFDADAEVLKTKNACGWSMKYQSVVGFGRASFIEIQEQKEKALAVIMKQYSDETFQFSDDAINKTSVIKIEIASMSGKRSGF